jgi:hypothetical protein
MTNWKSTKHLIPSFLLGAGILVSMANATPLQAQLSQSRARNLLRRAAGFELSGGAVRVKSISAVGPTSADIRADVRLVFKFQKDGRGIWRVAEIRTRQDVWEEVDVIARALGSQSFFSARLNPDECATPDPPLRGSLAIDPSNRRIRCLLGRLLGLAVPSDAVRVQEVAPLVIPIASQPSATVVAWIAFEARAVNDSKSGWRISELRTGERQWINLDQLVAAVNGVKQRRAQTDLERIAEALEKYRGDRGAYIVSDSHAVLIDHLSPKYLHEVIRVDPWHQPYKYAGQRDAFTLISTGPDGKEGTADDIARRK